MTLSSSFGMSAPDRIFSSPRPSRLGIDKQLSGFSSYFPHDGEGVPVLHSSSNSSSSSSSVVVTRRALMSFTFSVATFGQSRDAEAFVDDEYVGLKNGQLRGCEGGTSCVSTSAFRSPSRFMPPWSYLNSKRSAYADLVKTLERMGAHIVERDDEKYVYATMSSPNDELDIDDLEFLFVGSQVCFRSRSRKSIPDPPFCWWPGCINGPRNRRRMEAIRDELGWIPMETDEEKVWVPLLLH